MAGTRKHPRLNVTEMYGWPIHELKPPHGYRLTLSYRTPLLHDWFLCPTTKRSVFANRDYAAIDRRLILEPLSDASS